MIFHHLLKNFFKKIQTTQFLYALVFTAATALMAFTPLSTNAQEMPMHSLQLNSWNTAAGVGAQTTNLSSAASGNTNSGVQFTNVPFNAFGMRWNGSALDAHKSHITVDLYYQGEYVDTVELPHIDSHLKEALPANVQVTQPAIVPVADAFEVHVRLDSHSGAPVQMNDVEFIYYDTRGTTDAQIFAAADTSETDNSSEDVSTAKSSSSVDIISRSDWGANEDLRFKKNGDQIWEQEFEPISHIIIHHTAASDGGDTPSATVRAIYQWHTQTLKWGDIGYNFLIAPNGNIYKGRAGKVSGGIGVVGGHTFNSSTDTDFNPNSIGIALLGCYEHSSSCDTQHTMTPKMRKALKRLIASIAKESGFEPKSQAKLRGEQLPRILGHRSVDSTLCPGDSVYDDLSTIRSEAQVEYNSVAKKKYQASIAQVAIGETLILNEPEIEVTGPTEMTVTYTNNGLRKWKQKKLRLKIYDDTGKKKSSLRHKKWKDRFGRIRMNEDVVLPGEQATFTVPIKTPVTPETVQFVTKLFYAKAKVKKSNGTTAVQFVQSYAGELTETEFPLGAFTGTTQAINLSFTNTGTERWGKGTKLFMNGKAVGSFDKRVKPGKSATTTIEYSAPKKAGVKSYTFYLKNKHGRIRGTRHVRLVQVENTL